MSTTELASFIEPLRAFIQERHLDGRACLADDDPLLEWGILDSLALADLVAFIEEHFAIILPLSVITPGNFRTLHSLAGMLQQLSGEGLSQRA